MCGRYGRRGDKQYIAEHYRLRDFVDVYPSYNIAPDSFQPVVRLNGEDGEREAALLRWGLVPFWSKTPKATFSSINARAESLETSGAWREPFRQRRCLIPADFFYAWEKTGPNAPQPWAVALKDDQLFSFGGIWDRWKDKQTGKVLETFSIVTTDPNELLEPFHNRCPLIIEPRDYDRWLAPAEPHRLPVDLVRTYPAEGMKAWKVAKLKGDGPHLLEQVETPPDLFGSWPKSSLR